MQLNPLNWLKSLYRNAAAAGLQEFHADLAAAAHEAGIDPSKPLSVATLGELLPKMLPAAPAAELARGEPAGDDGETAKKRRR